MTPPTSDQSIVRSKNVQKRSAFASLLFGILGLLACELPIILTAIGLGGMAIKFRLPAIVEIIAIIALVVGVGLLIGLYVKRKRYLK